MEEDSPCYLRGHAPSPALKADAVHSISSKYEAEDDFTLELEDELRETLPEEEAKKAKELIEGFDGEAWIKEKKPPKEAKESITSSSRLLAALEKIACGDAGDDISDIEEFAANIVDKEEDQEASQDGV